LAGRDGREECQRAEPDQEPVGCRAFGETERAAQRVALTGRNGVELVEERHQQLVQRGEAEIAFGLDADEPQDAEPVRVFDGVVQERGLADAGLAPENEDAAEAGPNRRDRAFDRRLLVVAPDQRGHSAQGKRAMARSPAGMARCRASARLVNGA
jgi:hypothetical protein